MTGPADDVRDELTELRARVRALEDVVALHQLVARYGPAVDSGSADAAASLWTDDGVFDVPPYAVWTGHDGIASMVEGEGHQALIHGGAAHVLTAPRVVVDGDQARAWNYALNIRWAPDEERFWIGRVSANEWRFVRQDGGWRAESRLSYTLDGAAAARELLGHSAQIDDATTRRDDGA